MDGGGGEGGDGDEGEGEGEGGDGGVEDKQLGEEEIGSSMV